MNAQTLRLSEVARLPDAERKARYAEFMRVGIAPNGEVEELDRQIATLEQVYERSSDTMQKQVAEGSLRETAEIGRWLTLLELRHRVLKQTP